MQTSWPAHLVRYGAEPAALITLICHLDQGAGRLGCCLLDKAASAPRLPQRAYPFVA